MKALEIKKLSCSYGNTKILSELNLKIDNGEIVCLLGKSGCGKTTLLKIIAGLLQPEKGTIYFQGKEVSSSTAVIPPEKRKMGMIFQDYALFPHLTVFQNIAFGLKRLTKIQINHRVDELLELVNLRGLDKRYPHELSGGQQQRVAIARALANKPGLLLLDEPFSNIDSQVRQHLALEIRDILKQQHVTALLVTHNREEGFAFADTLAIMEEGSICQSGSAFDIYQQPNSRFVADLMGVANYIPVTTVDKRLLKTPFGVVTSTADIPFNSHENQKTFMFVRPNQISTAYASEAGNNRGHIIRQQFIGHTTRSEIKVQNQIIIVEHSAPLNKNKAIELSIQPHSVILFDQEGNALR